MGENDKKSKKGKPTAFQIALAVHDGTLPKEALRGAAKRLFHQFSKDELVIYAKQRQPKDRPLLFQGPMKKSVRSA